MGDAAYLSNLTYFPYDDKIPQPREAAAAACRRNGRFRVDPASPTVVSLQQSTFRIHKGRKSACPGHHSSRPKQIMEPLSATASIIAVIQGIGVCWKIYSGLKDARSDIEELQKEVASVEELVKRVRQLVRSPEGNQLSKSKELENALQGACSELERLEKKLGSQTDRKTWGLKRRVKWPFTGPDVVKITGNLERWKTSIGLALNIDQAHHLGNIDQKLDLASLPRAEGAAYGSFTDQYEPECLEGTRTELQKSITGWVEDPDGKPIFWLSGAAGTGKSTISRTIARELKKKDQLAASFFFRRGEKDRGGAKMLFTTLAFQLANRIRDIAPSIKKALMTEPDLPNTSISEQFVKLILQPLSQLNSPQYAAMTAIMVIDALDECAREADQELIVLLLGRLKEARSIDMRVFLTSRPELPLRLGFEKLSAGTYQDVVLHEAPGIEHDITVFLKDEFTKMRKIHSIPPDWPEDSDVQKLAEMAVPLFIFAATACRFIGDRKWDPRDQIKTVMENSWDNRHTCKSTLDPFTGSPFVDQ
ncbi:hypothetical protein ABW19_dt0210345 [Dactylella cylindrospora]|nr:hypothetical protein ABW19_dt0210345 [Dactylella cylindrospora]